MSSSNSADNGRINYSFYIIVLLLCIIIFFVYKTTRQDTLFFEPDGARHLPAKTLPVPSTVSQQMESIIAKPLNPLAFYVPANESEWMEIINKFNGIVTARVLPALRELFPAEVENLTVGGVNAYMITPHARVDDKEEILLIGMHGGGYMLFGGEAVLPENLAMAHYSRHKVLAVDYRMPPKDPFPAALDDVIALYTELIKTHDPKKIGMFGTSAGSGLLLAAVLKMHELNLPLPKVLSIGTPWSDLTETGDSYIVNEYVDNVVVSYNGMAKAMAQQYAHGQDLQNPYLSPVYGTYTKDFPPSVLTTGTRDLFLSNTVRVFRKLCQANVDAELQVFEGMSHAFYVEVYDAPESREAFEQIVKFLDKHLHD